MKKIAIRLAIPPESAEKLLKGNLDPSFAPYSALLSGKRMPITGTLFNSTFAIRRTAIPAHRMRGQITGKFEPAPYGTIIRCKTSVASFSYFLAASILLIPTILGWYILKKFLFGLPYPRTGDLPIIIGIFLVTALIAAIWIRVGLVSSNEDQGYLINFLHRLYEEHFVNGA